jgi:hypothetical protein
MTDWRNVDWSKPFGQDVDEELPFGDDREDEAGEE